MAESFFAELKRYVRFGHVDEEALRGFAPHAAPHSPRIADHFYDRLSEHEEARAVLEGPEQVQRLKTSLRAWLALLLEGPWDEAYYQRRARIGRAHVDIALPQRFMFAAMDVIRIELLEVAHQAIADHRQRLDLVRALHKILDLELAIMLETYREAFVDEVQRLGRLERAALERQLALSEARYEEIVEKGEALTVTYEPDGGILLFNRRCEEITGIDRRDAQGLSWFELFCAESDREAVRARCAEVLAGKRVAPYEGPVVAPAGGKHLVRWHLTTFPGHTEPVLCAIGVDVTEERELAIRTRRAERLAALGTMAAGLAHEIRNPLNAAHIQLVVAQRRLGREPSRQTNGARSAIDLASGEMKRLAGLVEDFLRFARPQPLRLARVDLRATVETTVGMVALEAEAAGIELVFEQGEPLELELDGEKVTQVIYNLLRNAVEACEAGGRVTVRVDSDNAIARVTVEDDGRGLPLNAPIFEPFFTTKDQGTGLGLAIVHRIVSDHGGTVDVESRPGRTVFAVSLPIVRQP